MGALNYNEGKSRPSLILGDLPNAFQAILDVRENGAVKYSRMNFLESLGEDGEAKFRDDNMDSILRHILAMYKESKDSESGQYHAAHAAVRLLFELEYECRSSI